MRDFPVTGEVPSLPAVPVTAGLPALLPFLCPHVCYLMGRALVALHGILQLPLSLVPGAVLVSEDNRMNSNCQTDFRWTGDSLESACPRYVQVCPKGGTLILTRASFIRNPGGTRILLFFVKSDTAGHQAGSVLRGYGCQGQGHEHSSCRMLQEVSPTRRQDKFGEGTVGTVRVTESSEIYDTG